MRVIIRIGRSASCPETLLFAYVSPKKSHTGLVLSLAMHVVAIVAYAGVAHLAQALGGSDVDLSRYSVKPLRVLIPDSTPLVEPRGDFAMQRAGRAAEGAGKGVLRQGGARPGRGSVRMAAGAGSSVRIPQNIELPPLPVLREVRLAVLQPQDKILAAILKPQTGAIGVWSRRGPGLERKKGLILPRGTDRQVPPTIELAPRLEVPNLVLRAGTLNLAEVLTTVQPALPVVPSSTSLIRMKVADAYRTLSSDGPETRAGDLANVLLLSALHPVAAEVIDLPPGSSFPQSHSSDAAGNAAGSEMGPAGQPQRGSGVGEGGRGVAQGPGAAQGAGVAQGAGGDGDTGDSHASGDGQRGPAGAGAEPGSAPVRNPVRNYDVVVIQSSAADVFAGSTVTLSGKPVYSVYLDIGTGRLWLLQYCIPKNAAVRVEDRVVSLDGLDSVEPPIALSTALPPSPGRSCPAYTLIHGLLTDRGRFRNLQVVGGDCVAEWLQLLEPWSFQPALKDKNPIEVEILLAIPPGA